jgi:hypothetical protein
MAFRILAHRPYGTIPNNLTTNPINVGTWTVLSAALPWPACAIEIFNPSGSTIQISTGVAGQESNPNNLIPYTILPGGSSILLPIELKKGIRLSASAIDMAATAGYFTMNFFG